MPVGVWRGLPVSSSVCGRKADGNDTRVHMQVGIVNIMSSTAGSPAVVVGLTEDPLQAEFGPS